MRCLASFLATMALGGCGSVVPARVPADPPSSPPLKTSPAGEVTDGRQVVKDTVVDGGRTYSIDRDRSRLDLAAGAMTTSQRTCPAPVALATADHGARVAVLCRRALELYDASTLQRLAHADAGRGASDLATDGAGVLYVTDALGNALLVFRLHPFALVRHVRVAGNPYAIAYDREGWGLWIALAGTNQLVNFTAGVRPVPRRTVPSIRDARAVSVDAGVVTVFGQDQRQVLRVRPK